MSTYDAETLKKVQDTELSILADFHRLCKEHNLEYFLIAGSLLGAIRHKGMIPWDDDIDVGMPRKDYEKLREIIKNEKDQKYRLLDQENDIMFPLMTGQLVKNGTVFRPECLKTVKCELGIYLDIFPFDNVADEKEAYIKQVKTAWIYSKFRILRDVPEPMLAVDGLKKGIIYFACRCVWLAMIVCCISRKFLYKNCKKYCLQYQDIDTKKMSFMCETSPYGNLIKRKDLYPIQTAEFNGLTVNIPNNYDKILTDMYGDYMTPPPEGKRNNHCPIELKF